MALLAFEDKVLHATTVSNSDDSGIHPPSARFTIGLGGERIASQTSLYPISLLCSGSLCVCLFVDRNIDRCTDQFKTSVVLSTT